MKTILGLGNALVDLMIKLDSETLLNQLDMPKGSMTLIDENSRKIIAELTEMMSKTVAAGGSAANTINGLANLGVSCSFIGKIGAGEVGQYFKNDMLKNQIHPILLESNTPSGCAYAFVTPDSERTFATYLGAAIELCDAELDENWFKNAAIFYIEGYLVYNQPLVERAIALAKANNVMVVLDLASFNVVEDCKPFLENIMPNVDIVFANEEEAKAFTGKSPEESVEILAQICEIAVVKIGAKGSLIMSDNKLFTVAPKANVNALDTTGAGDMYAAGFIYGYLNNYDLGKCGAIGSILSGNVIEVLGAKMDDLRWQNIKLDIATI